MANIQSLFILVAAFLCCEVVQFSNVSAANSNYYSSLKVAAATKLRNGECQDGVWALAKCKSIVKQLGLGICYTQIPQLQRKLKRSCPGTCRNLCPVAANKLIAGELKKSDDCKTSKYGCCWDNYTSRLDSLGIKGCPECKDHLRLCPRFKKYAVM
ncbi:uncharacterized protein [Montipora capricornis]|uniref:uncharacterized protein n=1 Tax=Montipora capricornis TaxID=246305 RepID=UPI0035F1C7CF